ncbi:MAG: hypothetical protein ACFFKA_18105 [Candidatus Thorarchaeota archaeon]
MYKNFLILYFKKTSKGFILFITIVILIMAVTVFTNQWNISLIVISALSVIYYINLEIKQAKICIILDTHNLQKKFFEEQKLFAIKNNRLTKLYKKWLINYAIKQNLEMTYNFFIYKNINIVCCYCFYNLIPVILILGMSLLFLPYIQAWAITLIFLMLSLTLFILTEVKFAKQKYKLLDSEIKRIVFEEETGYSPLQKRNFTFKYRVWLIKNERKQTKSIFVNNI